MAFDLNIVSSKNIAKKAIEAVEQLDKALEQSILNDSSKAAKYAIVQENLKDVKNTLSSFSSVLKSIDETFNIKTLIKLSILQGSLLSRRNPFTTLRLIIRGVFNLFDDINNHLKSAGSGTKSNINTFSDWIGAITNLFSVKTIAGLLLAPKVIGFANWSKFRTSLNNFVEAIVDVVTNEKLNSLDNTDEKIKSFKEIINVVNSLKGLIATALLISLAVIPASLIIVPGMIALKLMLKYIFYAIASVTTGFTDRLALRKVREVRNLLLSIGATFVLFTLTIYTLGEVAADKEIWIALGAFSALVTATFGLLWFLGSRVIRHYTKEGMMNILAVGATFALFALTLYTLGEAAVDKEMKYGVAAFVTLVGTAVGLLLVLSSNKMQNSVKDGGITLALISAAFIGFTATAWLLSKMTIELSDFTNIAYVFALALAGASTLLLISKFDKSGDIKKGAIGLAIIAGALVGFIAVIWLASRTNITEKTLISLGVVAGIITVITVALMFVSSASGSVILGAAALAIAAGAVYLFAVLINKLDNLIGDIDLWKIVENMASMAAIMLAYIPLGAAAIAAAAVGILAIPATKAVVGSILFAAESFMAASTYVDTINYDGLLKFISGSKEDGTVGFRQVIDAFIESARGIKRSEARKSANIIKKISSSIVELAKGISAIGSLDFDITKITGNISNIFTCLFDALSVAAEDDNLKAILNDGGLLKGKSTANKVLDAAFKLSDLLGTFAGSLNLIASGKIKDSKGNIQDIDFGTAGANLSKMILGFINSVNVDKIDVGKDSNIYKLVDLLGGNKFSSAMDQLLRIQSDTGQNIDSVASSLAKVTTSINSIDIERMKKLTNLLAEVNKLAKGINFNFDGLAKIINEKLVVTLNELKEVLEDLNGSFENGNKPAEVSTQLQPAAPAPVSTSTPTETGNSKSQYEATISTTISSISKLLENISSCIPAGGTAMNVKVTNPYDFEEVR